MPLRETRRFKTKGYGISFGDIMLPLVGFVAIGLLAVAGKLFFMSGMQQSRPPLPVIVGTPPQQERPAQAEESRTTTIQREEKTPEKEVSSTVSADVMSRSRTEERRTLDVLAIPYNEAQPVQAQPQNRSTVTVREPVKPQAQAEPKPQTNPQVQAKPQSARSTVVIQTPAPQNPKPAVAQEKTAVSPNSNWMVQVGAFSTQAAAQNVAQQATKAGHTATIVSGRTLHRVLVQSGSTREEALALATRLSRSGFEGAFIVPPR